MTGRLKQTHLLGVDAQLALGSVEDAEDDVKQCLNGGCVRTLKKINKRVCFHVTSDNLYEAGLT